MKEHWGQTPMCFTQPAGFHQLRAAGVSARYLGFERHLSTVGSDPIKRPHKEKINISKEIINKTRGAVALYAAQIFTHLSVVSSRQRSYDWLRCEGRTLDRRNKPHEDK